MRENAERKLLSVIAGEGIAGFNVHHYAQRVLPLRVFREREAKNADGAPRFAIPLPAVDFIGSDQFAAHAYFAGSAGKTASGCRFAAFQPLFGQPVHRFAIASGFHFFGNG